MPYSKNQTKIAECVKNTTVWKTLPFLISIYKIQTPYLTKKIGGLFCLVH